MQISVHFPINPIIEIKIYQTKILIIFEKYIYLILIIGIYCSILKEKYHGNTIQEHYFYLSWQVLFVL